jgi:hypothetical protein
MRGLTAILRHEVAERRVLLLAGPLLGLLPFLMPLLPGAAAREGAELRDAAALFLALTLSGLAAVLLGATAIASDLAERRLGFFFSRPVSGAAIWAGKLGGAALCAWAAGLLAAAPVVLFDAATGHAGGLLRNTALPARLVAIGFISLPLALLAAHALGVILRTRSAWLVLDLCAATVVATLVTVVLRRLDHWGLLRSPSQLVPALVLAAGLALLAASASQVLGGRIDPVRAHRRLSLTLAALGIAGAVGFAILAHRWIAAGPLDMPLWHIAFASPGQSWLAVAGDAPGPPGAGAAFLLQPGSGRSRRLRAAGSDPMPPIAFSADGKRAVWAEYQGAPLRSPGVVMQLDLERADAEPVQTLIGVPNLYTYLALSPNGTVLAVAPWNGHQVAVYDVGSGRLLAAHSFGDSADTQAVFLTDDRLRLLVTRYSGDGKAALDLYDLELASRTLVQLGSVPGASYWRSLSPDASHIAVNNRYPHQTAVYEVAGGRQLARLEQPGGRISAFYLADGRLATQVAVPTFTELTVRDGEGGLPPGAPRCRFRAGTWLTWVRQIAADRLLAVAIQPMPRGGSRLACLLVDLARGAARPLEDGLEPVPTLGKLAVGGTPLFLGGNHLLRIDFTTGERHILGPARPYEPLFYR